MKININMFFSYMHMMIILKGTSDKLLESMRFGWDESTLNQSMVKRSDNQMHIECANRSIDLLNKKKRERPAKHAPPANVPQPDKIRYKGYLYPSPFYQLQYNCCSSI